MFTIDKFTWVNIKQLSSKSKWLMDGEWKTTLILLMVLFCCAEIRCLERNYIAKMKIHGDRRSPCLIPLVDEVLHKETH